MLARCKRAELQCASTYSDLPLLSFVSAVSEHPYVVTTSCHIVFAADDQRRQRSKPQSNCRMQVSEMHLKTKFNVGGLLLC